MSKIIIIQLLVFSVISCKQDSISINHRDMSYVELKRKILREGSIEAYQDLSTKLLDEDEAYLLPYSIVMANKYDYSRSYYDVFEILISGCVTDYNLDCLDEKTKKMALDYLNLAVEKGDVTASEILLEFYDKGKFYPIKKIYEDQDLIDKAKQNIVKNASAH